MSKTQRTAKARVQITVEIDVTDSWGDECTISQIRSQALTSAEGVIARAFKPCDAHGKEGDIRCKNNPPPIRMVGHGKVTAFTVEA